MVRRAAEVGIRKLYHYEPFMATYLEETIVNHRVHFSNPNLPAAEQRFYETKLLTDPHFFKEALQTDFREGIRNMILERYRVYCLSPDCYKPLMWSHYANKHQGICLEFDVGKSVIGNAYQVKYGDALPTIDVLSVACEEATGEEAFQILVSKSQDWWYENEYRILARDGAADEVAPGFLPITNNDFLQLPPGALSAIIVGCRAKPEEVKEIKAIVEKRALGLPVKRARQASDKYHLSILD
jgi:hypothetical protein